MSPGSSLDLIYDQLVAEERRKTGTKFERLAAIAFAALDGRTTVHDLRLRGASGVRHQIDVTVGDDRRRLLVECKQYDGKVGLSVVRDFWAVVDDVVPDEAFVVTTVGFTRDAIRFAEAKGLKLAVLRQATNADLEGRITSVTVDMIVTVLHVTGLRWQVDAADPVGDAASERDHRRVLVWEASVTGAGGDPIGLGEFIQRELDANSAYDGDPGPRSGIQLFAPPRTLTLPREPPVRVVALEWRGKLHLETATVDRSAGAGGLVAELALAFADGEVLGVLSNRAIEHFGFLPDGKVVDRAIYTPGA